MFEEEVSGGSRRACLGFPVVYRRKRSRFKRLNSPTGRQGVEEVRWRGGSVGAELRRKRCDGGKRRWLCKDGGSKLRRAARGGRMSQILTRVRLCLLPARQSKPSVAGCGPWAMFLIWASTVFLMSISYLGFVGCKLVNLGFGRGLGPCDQYNFNLREKKRSVIRYDFLV